MSVHLQRQPSALLAQLAAVAEKCPLHKQMTSVTTDITTTVDRVA
jgi:putative redox protein